MAIKRGKPAHQQPRPRNPVIAIRVSPVTFARIQKSAKDNKRTMSEEMNLQIEQAHAVQNFLGTAQEAYERIKLLNRQTIRTEMAGMASRRRAPSCGRSRWTGTTSRSRTDRGSMMLPIAPPEADLAQDR